LFGLGLVALAVCFVLKKYFLLFCIFGFNSFLSAVLLFYGGQFNGRVPFW